MSLRWKIAQAVEIRWWKRYLKHRPPEEYLLKKKAYWQKVLQLLEVFPEPAESVLDAGCGPAGIFMVLDQQAVDAVDPLIDHYQQDLPHFQQDNYPWVNFYTCPFESFSNKGPYDKVFCMNAINHFDNLPLSVDRLLELTRPGGELLLSVDAHNYSLLKYIFRLLPGDILHPHQYDLKEYCRFFETEQSKVIKTHLYRSEFIFNHYLLSIHKTDTSVH